MRLFLSYILIATKIVGYYLVGEIERLSLK
jgi:hypothetical protein